MTPPHLRRYDELEGKTFLVCVGAMKSATSWVSWYLASLPGVVVSPIKEVHFFNARFPVNALGDMETVALKRLAWHLEHRTPTSSAAFQASVDRVQMSYDDNAYFGHFARICRPGTRILCDVTPAYAVIGAEGFADLKDFCATQGVRLKLMFLMRDPVDRLWSQLRHLQEINPDGAMANRWSEAIQSPQIMARADYRATIGALDALFAPQDIHYGFYEDLFVGKGLRALCDFLDVPYRPGEADQPRNRTDLELALPLEARSAFRDVLAPQYAFCRARFGKDLPNGWAG